MTAYVYAVVLGEIVVEYGQSIMVLLSNSAAGHGLDWVMKEPIEMTSQVPAAPKSWWPRSPIGSLDHSPVGEGHAGPNTRT